jgi:tRNA G10  N-methylase Trm11
MTPRRIETSLVVAEDFRDSSGGEWERGDRAPLARRAVREAAMEHPDWFRIEYETVELTSREEWLAAIHENYEARYRQAKQRRDGAQEQEQAALRAEMEEQEKGQPDLERRYKRQQKDREAREKARRADHERRVIENELELGALPSGFHYDDR